jgi:NTE family protein
LPNARRKSIFMFGGVTAQPYAQVMVDSFVDRVAFLISSSKALPTADDECIRSIAEAADRLSVLGGSTLISQGDPSETIFIVASGLFGAYFRTDAGDEIMVGRIGPGETVGEMGCVTGEPRSATIRALRTSEVIAISWRAVEHLARSEPAVLLSVCRTVVRRLRTAQEGRHESFAPRTFCVLPHTDENEARTFVVDLTAALASLGPSALVTKDKWCTKTVAELLVLEAAHEYVVYLAEHGQTPWSRRCLRQADTVLVAACGNDPISPIGPFGEIINPGIPVDLVLLWRDRIVQGRTATWFDALHPRRVFHVRAEADVQRAARLLCGKGLGLVLTGGAARGFAHMGVARALAEHGITIDATCGTSKGALVGALIAMEWDFEAMRRAAHAFSRKHLLWELTLPRVSLLSGRNLKVSLEKGFGEWEIEETPIRYACVSTDLAAGSANVHLRGKLKTWIMASASVPGMFPPVVDSEVVHVDGGISNNLPADIIRDMGVGFVVGVDVGGDAVAPADSPPGVHDVAAQSRRQPNIFEILMRVGTISSGARGPMRRRQCDLLLLPEVQGLGLLNVRAYNEAIAIGYQCTVANMDPIKRRMREMRASNASRVRAPGRCRFTTTLTGVGPAQQW